MFKTLDKISQIELLDKINTKERNPLRSVKDGDSFSCRCSVALGSAPTLGSDLW